MRFKLIALLLLLSFQSFFSYGEIIKKEFNRIIIWDVTASMVGTTPNGEHNQATDIDDDVREALRKLIASWPNDNSTFRILPFTTDILDLKQIFQCNPSGKKQALDYINSYKIDPVIKGYTNICAAYENANSYIDKSKDNFIYLYTDGEQNIAYGPNGRNCLQPIIDKYCTLTHGASFTYFISIGATNKVNFSPECGTVITTSEPPPTPHYINLSSLISTLVVNIQEGLSPVIRFKEKGDRDLGVNFKANAKIIFQNPAYTFDVEVKLKKESNSSADFQINFIDYTNSTLNRMKQIANLNENAILQFETSDKEVKFMPSEIAVTFKYEKPKPVQKVNIKID